MAAAKKVLVVAGARPNFMKVAPILRAIERTPGLQSFFVHTGQHYDYRMSEIFFQELRIPKPDIHLNVGSGTHAEQTAKIMTAFEKVVLKERPQAVVVVGDVNSTVACTLAASKLCVPVAHVEAGLRSFDRTMPEEINRLATDAISDWLFVSEPSGVENLRREGADRKKIHFVGNVMIDSLVRALPDIKSSKVLTRHDLAPGGYAVVTLHRPSNVDSRQSLLKTLDIFSNLSKKVKLIYPIHPRTAARIETLGLAGKFRKVPGLQLVEPQGYLNFVQLIRKAKFVLTDSGGIQEETTYLRVPCLTMRENTERPITITQGTNVLVGQSSGKIKKAVARVLSGKWKKGSEPKYWDGHAAVRIVRVLKKALT